MVPRAVIDTNVFVAALLGPTGPNRQVIRRCLEGRVQPQMSTSLFCEYEDLLRRPGTLDRCPLSPAEREELLDAFLSVSRWVEVFFLWRPNLPDEGDNHVLELALAAGAALLITNNIRDFRSGELRFERPRIVTPPEALRSLQP